MFWLISYDEFLRYMISSKKIVTDERLSALLKSLLKIILKLSVQEIINDKSRWWSLF